MKELQKQGYWTLQTLESVNVNVKSYFTCYITLYVAQTVNT